MSEYKHTLSFEDRCRQPMDAPLRARELRDIYDSKEFKNALDRFFKSSEGKEVLRKCKEIQKKYIDNSQPSVILPELKEDR